MRVAAFGHARPHALPGLGMAHEKVAKLCRVWAHGTVPGRIWATQAERISRAQRWRSWVLVRLLAVPCSCWAGSSARWGPFRGLPLPLGIDVCGYLFRILASWKAVAKNTVVVGSPGASAPSGRRPARLGSRHVFFSPQQPPFEGLKHHSVESYGSLN